MAQTAPPNPVPLINQPLAPDAAAPGSAAFTLTVNGTGFVSGSVVKWNGQPLTTTFVSNKQLTAAVTATNIASPGTASVTVANPTPGGGTSNVVFFPVMNPIISIFHANAAGSPQATGTDPRFVAVADFNGDGKQDLAVTNFASNTLTILLGNGDGTFTSAASPVTGSGPFSVAVGDFNGDGKQDLAVTNYTSNTLAILLGNGDGTFTPAASPATGTNPSFVAVGDFNGDGKLDLAVSNANSNNMTILLGNGDGTFTPAASPATSSFPYSVAVGDFNGDGKLDLAVSNANSNNVTILLGNGDGTFTPATSPPATGSFPYSMAIGDFNGDGKLDLAVANYNSNTMTILLGNGNGTFTPAASPATGTKPRSVAVGDFNGDGKLDLAVVNNGSNNLTILQGDGTGNFTPTAETPATGGNPFYAAVGDFNGDGRLDLAVPNSGTNNISILLLAPAGSDNAAFQFSATSNPNLPWSYGWSTSRGATFNLYDTHAVSSGLDTWTSSSQGSLPVLLLNPTGSTISPAGSNSFLPGQLGLHPGPSGQNSIVRWTAPVSGNFNVSASFTGRDSSGPTTTDVAVLHGACQLFSGNVNGFGPSSAQSFSGTAPVAAGDSIDFTVGVGTDGSYLFDSSALDATITRLGAATFTPVVSLSTSNLTMVSLVGSPSAVQTVNLTNSCAASVSITSIAPSAGFTETNTCGTGLVPGGSCNISVTFTATVLGTQTGQLTITDNAAGSPQVVNLSGTGVQVANLSVTALNFDNQVVNTTSGPRAETLTNYGSTTITITSIVAAGPFAVNNTASNACATSLAAGASCKIVTTFTPTSLGAQAGTITITDNAPNNLQVINLTGNGVVAPPTTCPTNLAQLNLNYGNLPLTFEANLGQTDPQVKYLSRGRGYGLFLTPAEAVLALQKSESRNQKSEGKTTDNGPRTTDSVLRMQLLNANANAKVTGLDEQPGQSNYFIGNDPTKWVKHAPTYAKVRYEQVYPGIDLVYYGNQRQLEYDFVVAPGADPKAITMDVGAGLALPKRAPQAAPLQIAANGDLLINTGSGEVRFHKPIVYQEKASVVSGHLSVERSFASLRMTSNDGLLTTDNGQLTADNPKSQITNQKFLDGHYILTADNRISFEVGAYDHTKPLIIDPVLSYATYLGGNGDDFAFGIAVDSTCSAYVSGQTTSIDLPVTSNAFQKTFGGASSFCGGGGGFNDCGDAFVTKLSPDGTALVYSTYLGGSDRDSATFMAVDSSGSAYVAGQTQSTNFPVTTGAFQTTLRGSTGNKNAFVTRLSPDGSSLLYSTYLGGSNGDQATGMAADSSGNAYFTGRTSSSDFPVTPGAFQTTLRSAPCQMGKCGTAFVAKINTNATGTASLVYATFLGGSGQEESIGIAIDASGDAYVAGSTTSSDFPTTPSAFQPAFGGGSSACNHDQIVCGDAFMTKLNPTGTALLYSTYLGGSGEDSGIGVAVDSSGAAYVSGGTDSSNFPTTAGAFQTVFGGGSVGCTNAGFACGDGFVAKIDTTKSGAASLVYSTYFGGLGDDITLGIAVDAGGNAHVAGITNSTTGFSLTPDATQNFFGGGTHPCTNQNFICGDAFVTKLNPAGSGLIFSTYLGGSGDDGGFGLALDSQGNAYVTGVTDSTDFPVTAGAFQTTFGGGITDAFVARIAGINHPVVTFSTPSLTFSNQLINTPSAAQTVILSNSGTALLTITSITATGTNPGDYLITNNNCPISPSTLAAKSTCTISVTFTPTAAGSRSASVSITDNAAGSPHTVSLSGTGTAPAAGILPASLTFSSQNVGTTSTPQTITLTNTGTAPLTVTSITASGDFAVTPNCGSATPPFTLNPGILCTVNVTFTPTVTGTRSGTITFTDNAAGSPQTVSLTGTGTSPAQLTLSATSLTLPDTHVNQTCTPRSVTLTNSGTAPLTISNISIGGPYTETNTCPVGAGTLAPGTSCAVTVTFAPTVVGTAESGTLTITSNAPSSPNTVALSGNATAACLLLPAVQTVTLLRGTDSTTFSLTHQTQGGEAEAPIQMSCTNQAPANCAFDPGTIGAMGVTTLTLTNLKALTANALLFQTHGDANLDHHTTGLSVLFSDFLVVSTPSSGTITAGQTASYAMAVAPQNGLQGTVSFNCTGAPTGATCAVTPAAVTLSGTASSNLTVTVTTTARSLVAPRNKWRVLPPGSSPMGLMLLAMLALLAGLVYCSAGRSLPWQGTAIRRLLCSAGLRPASRPSETGATTRLRLATMGLGLMLAVVLTWAACGGGSPVPPMSQNAVATPAGTYNLTVTGTYSAAGTSAQIVHNTTLTLTVH